METPSPLAYTTVADVRALLDKKSTADDAAILSLIHGVSEEISAGLGVVWDGGEGDASDRFCPNHLGTIVLPIPAVRIHAIRYGDTVLAAEEYAMDLLRDGGQLRGILLRSEFYGVASMLVTATWADRPGGDPPLRIRSFATWAVKQRWQLRETGGSAQRGLDGLVTTFIENPFRDKPDTEWGGIVRDFKVTRTAVI